MKYATVEEAKNLPGLRLVLSAGVPGPWGEAAKGFFRLRGVDYVPVAQKPMAANRELVEWTGLRNAPVAVYGDEPPRDRWLDILMLAERLGHGPSLLPTDSTARALCIGIANEICGEWGLGWCCRVYQFEQNREQLQNAPLWPEVSREYGITEEACQSVPARIRDILTMLSAQLARQKEEGHDYLVGSQLTAADIYWATFSQVVAPMEPSDCPMPDFLRRFHELTAGAFADAASPELIAHRDFVFQKHLGLPMDF